LDWLLAGVRREARPVWRAKDLRLPRLVMFDGPFKYDGWPLEPLDY
jgi:hypothetical protein